MYTGKYKDISFCLIQINNALIHKFVLFMVTSTLTNINCTTS